MRDKYLSDAKDGKCDDASVKLFTNVLGSKKTLLKLTQEKLIANIYMQMRVGLRYVYSLTGEGCDTKSNRPNSK